VLLPDCAQNQEDEEHYDNVDDMYADINDRLEAVEAAAPVNLAAHVAKGVVKDVKGTPKGDKVSHSAASTTPRNGACFPRALGFARLFQSHGHANEACME